MVTRRTDRPIYRWVVATPFLDHLSDDEARNVTVFLTTMIALEEGVSHVLAAYFAPERSEEFTTAFLDGMTMGRKLDALKVVVRDGAAPDHMAELRKFTRCGTLLPTASRTRGSSTWCTPSATRSIGSTIWE